MIAVDIDAKEFGCFFFHYHLITWKDVTFWKINLPQIKWYQFFVTVANL